MATTGNIYDPVSGQHIARIENDIDVIDSTESFKINLLWLAVVFCLLTCWWSRAQADESPTMVQDILVERLICSVSRVNSDGFEVVVVSEAIALGFHQFSPSSNVDLLDGRQIFVTAGGFSITISPDDESLENRGSFYGSTVDQLFRNSERLKNSHPHFGKQIIEFLKENPKSNMSNMPSEFRSKLKDFDCSSTSFPARDH